MLHYSLSPGLVLHYTLRVRRQMVQTEIMALLMLWVGEDDDRVYECARRIGWRVADASRGLTARAKNEGFLDFTAGLYTVLMHRYRDLIRGSLRRVCKRLAEL